MMTTAIIGPICKDRNMVNGQTYSQIGGVTYYTGQALGSLGNDVTIFGSFGHESPDWLTEMNGRVIHIPAEKTITFINEYPEDNPDTRIQRAEIPRNVIGAKHLHPHNLNAFTHVVLGPLFHNNLSFDLFERLGRSKPTVFLSPQGLIRYLEGDSIVWKNPENVRRILRFVDYLCLSENELRFIAQTNDIVDGARALQQEGVPNVIVTRGKQGSMLFLGKRQYRIRAFPPKRLRDPTGAGDSYLAGFIKGLELFDDPIKQGEFAAMTATLSLENHGLFNRSLTDVYNRLGWK